MNTFKVGDRVKTWMGHSGDVEEIRTDGKIKPLVVLVDTMPDGRRIKHPICQFYHFDQVEIVEVETIELSGEPYRLGADLAVTMGTNSKCLPVVTTTVVSRKAGQLFVDCGSFDMVADDLTGYYLATPANMARLKKAARDAIKDWNDATERQIAEIRKAN